VSLTGTDERAIGRVVALLRPEQRLLFITGAGISADSGLPTYRGDGGLYGEGQVTRHGVSIEHALSGAMLKSRPAITWHYLHELERASRGATFNRGHRVIAEMEAHFGGVWTLTQNVDGLHRRAGARNVIDIHGDLHVLFCPRCDYREDVEDYALLPPLPRCPCCFEVLRPDVVLFFEELPAQKLQALERERVRGFDVVFSVGTSSVFPYISEPVQMAHAAGIPTVEIDPGQTSVSHLVDIKIPASAAATLDRLWQRYQARQFTG
jgi:NAD-dependent deacetylase